MGKTLLPMYVLFDSLNKEAFGKDYESQLRKYLIEMGNQIKPLTGVELTYTMMRMQLSSHLNPANASLNFVVDMKNTLLRILLDCEAKQGKYSLVSPYILVLLTKYVPETLTEKNWHNGKDGEWDKLSKTFQADIEFYASADLRKENFDSCLPKGISFKNLDLNGISILFNTVKIQSYLNLKTKKLHIYAPLPFDSQQSKYGDAPLVQSPSGTDPLVKPALAFPRNKQSVNAAVKSSSLNNHVLTNTSAPEPAQVPAFQRKLKVFLCHASQDKPIVRDLYQRLSAESWIDPWLDEESILAGQEWEYEIEKAVESADVVIVLLSNVSVNKEGYIQKEIRYALDIALEKPEGTIFIIPLRLDNCVVPRKIKHWQYVDYFPVERLDWAYKKILDSLRVRASNKGININEAQLLSVNTNEKEQVLDFGSSYIRRMPVYLLLEVDDSMSGVTIMAVEQGVQLLHNELLGEPQAVEMVNLSVVTYSTYAQQVVPLTPITSFTPPALNVSGVRNLGNALRVLGDCISREMIKNTLTKKGDFKALVFWITAGEPTDDWEAGFEYLKKRTDGLLGSIIALGAGDSVNIGVLRQITPNVLLMTDVTPDKLREFFRWQSQRLQ